MTTTTTDEDTTARALQQIFDVRGSRVLVTGAASGLGTAIAEALVACGARVTMLDVNADRLAAEAERLAPLPGSVRSVTADVSDATAVREAFRGVVEAEGGLDVVFANAGISLAPGIGEHGGTLETTDADRWHRVLGVNLDGVLYSLQTAASLMKPQRSGRIVVTASTAGIRNDPYTSYAYLAAKAAIINVVRQAALELAPHGVRVNAIAPGPFRTHLGDVRIAEGGGSLNDAVWPRTVPLGRVADPRELAGVALLLASGASSFMTGAVVPVDGGALVAYPTWEPRAT